LGEAAEQRLFGRDGPDQAGKWLVSGYRLHRQQTQNRELSHLVRHNFSLGAKAVIVAGHQRVEEQSL
jgi:hypothetical protein